MNFLSGLLGGFTLDVAVNEDLKRLNNLKAGLGDQASAYVRTGSDATVLSTISLVCRANELEVGRNYHQPKSPTPGRQRLLARAEPYDLVVMHRYAEVLMAASGSMPTSTARYAAEHFIGSDHAPRLIRVFFTEAFAGLRSTQHTWPPKAVTLDGKGLTPDRAVAMAERMGGGVVDVFDVIYGGADTYYQPGGELYRNAVSLLPLVQAHPDAFKAALKRISAPARATAIADLTKWKVAQSEMFISFIVEQAGDGAKTTREAAATALIGAWGNVVTPLAVAILQSGDATQRAGMVDLLARQRSPEALAALKAHRETEKTARIAAAIDTALSVSERGSAAASTGSAADDASGYTAIGGTRIEIPPMKPMPDGEPFRLSGEDRSALRTLIDAQNVRIEQQNEANKKNGHHYKHPTISSLQVDRAFDLFSEEAANVNFNGRDAGHILSWGPGAPWTRTIMQKMPRKAALRTALRLTGGARTAFFDYAQGPGPEYIQAFLNGPDGDMRHLEALDLEMKPVVEFGDYRQRTTRQARKGDLLRSNLQDAHYSYAPQLSRVAKQAMWPYIAVNLDVFDEAFGLAAPGEVKFDRAAAVRGLAVLPAAPERYFAPLLEVATGESKNGRAEARALLANAPEVEDRLIALLDDTRQAVRAGAAEWLSIRRDAGAKAALYKRLKKEKSEVARAAILSGLKRLGEDISNILTPSALIEEAEKGLKSAKFDKLSWMALDNLGHLRFRDGTKVSNDLLRWWIISAFKLKQPGGNALFEIYLDQLDARDAEAFSTWVLEAWVSYDTAKPSDAEANAYAKQHAKSRAQTYQRWQPNYTEEMAFATLKNEFMSQLPNSGAESKGVLALATRAPSALAADRVRAFLKAHGSRTSQASALLEMLAAKGDAVALQVVIAAATRLKQKGVQKFAGELITRVAEARDWTLDELADRTVPTAGFDEDGVLTLPVGGEGKEYEARLDADLNVVLRNPAGKDVANLPSGDDDATKASKKQLSSTKKELKQIASMQSTRLYEALCAERQWSVADWKLSFHDHPVMRRLVERIVWLGVDGEGKVLGAFRPTAEGDFTNTDDEPVDVDQFANVRIAHGALVDDVQGKAWTQHLKDYEVKPLFAQFGRAELRISDADAKKTMIEDRKGWVTDAFTIRGAASKLGYERGPALDGGFFNEYRKPFQSAGLAAVIEFTGNSLPEENVPAALTVLRFERATGPGAYSGVVTLGDVPPVLLSECWNDYHAMAAKAKYDAEWEKKSPW